MSFLSQQVNHQTSESLVQATTIYKIWKRAEVVQLNFLLADASSRGVFLQHCLPARRDNRRKTGSAHAGLCSGLSRMSKSLTSGSQGASTQVTAAACAALILRFNTHY
jgi:hypothetical protein